MCLPRGLPSNVPGIVPCGTRSFPSGSADMDKDYLTLKRASASRLSGEWSDDDYDVLADGVVVGRIFKVRPHADTAMSRRARPRWRRSPRAGGGSSSKIGR